LARRGSPSRALQQAKVALKDIEWRTAAEMRYLGQGASVEVNFGNDTPESLTAERLKTAFEASYKKLYGSLVPSGIPEVVTWRLAGQSMAAGGTVQPHAAPLRIS